MPRPSDDVAPRHDSGDGSETASERRGLFRRHRLRNEDAALWWRMPDDSTRTRSPWRQLPRDLVAPAPLSEWHEKVALTRVQRYDRIRPYVCRGVLVVLMGVALVVLRAGAVLALLLPAAVQVFLELYLYRYIALQETAPSKIAQWMSNLQQSHFQTMLVNTTGLIGVIAVPLNVIAVCLAPAGGEAGWVKIAALAAAVLYCVSALRNTFLDPPNFTEMSTMPQVMHTVRAYASTIAVVVIAGIVGFAHCLGRWEPAVLPLAYLTCGLAFLLGSMLRDNDRLLWAAVPTVREAIVAGRQDLGEAVHHDLSAMKAAAMRAAASPDLRVDYRLELQALEVFLTGFSTRVGLDHAEQMDLPSLASKVVSRYGILPEQVSVDDRLSASGIGREDHRVALKLLTALLHNAGQALEHEPLEVKAVTVRAWHTGGGADRVHHVAVDDRLPEVTADRWLRAGSTMAALDAWLSTTYGGSIRQYPRETGKSIEAQWFDRQVQSTIEPMEDW